MHAQSFIWATDICFCQKLPQCLYYISGIAKALARLLLCAGLPEPLLGAFFYMLARIYLLNFNSSFSTKAELDEHDHFKVFHQYDDAVTFKLIGVVCEVLGKLPMSQSIHK